MSQTYGDSRTLRSVVTGNYHATFWRPVREGNFPTEFNDSIGLVEVINEYCPKEPGEKISSGYVVKAMILNGLGFVSSPSRDHRPDLKQFIIELISSGDGDIPMFFEAASGNKSDSSNFPKIFSRYKEKLKDNDDLMVADAALYNAKNISLLSSMKWLCRVPLTIGIAKQLVSTLLSTDFTNSSFPGYYYCSKTINYGGIEQQWLIVESSERKKSDLRRLEKRISKSKVNASNQLKKLLNSKLKSQQEAISIVDNLNKKLKYHQIENVEYFKTKSNNKKDSTYFYQVNASLSENISAIKMAYNSAGRFILATNVLDEKFLSNDEMLEEYKAQQSCERGFGFIKDPLFFADSIFLKSPERIQAMAMIMGLCLLVYTLAQREIRKALLASKSAIKNQLGKAINNPTMRLIFQRFQSIHLVTYNDEKSISNWTSEREYILSFLPDKCRYYYKC